MADTRDPRLFRQWLDRALRPGDHVIWSQGAAEPTPLLEDVIALREQATGGALVTSIGFTETVTAEVADHLRLRGLGGLGSHRRLTVAGILEVLPTHLSQLPAAIRRGDVRVDVLLAQVAPADSTGRHSLGIDAAYTHAAMEAARLVVAEVNDRMPFTGGHALVDPDRFDLVLHTDRPLIEVPSRDPSPVERAIADHAVRVIPAGATLQFGIGSTPGAVARALVDRRGLGLHTGLMDDAQFALVRAGAVDVGHRRPVAGTLAGTRRLYIDAAKAGVLVRDAEHSHGLVSLSRLRRFTAVNTAVEVDLTGQVNAEVVGHRYVGGVSGLADFVRGALVSDGGRSVFVLPSTAADGRVSRIVSALAEGTVTVPRSDVDAVATEHGVAELRGRSLAERAKALRAIADPAHRDALGG